MRKQGSASKMSYGAQKKKKKKKKAGNGYQVLHWHSSYSTGVRNICSAPCSLESSAFFFFCLISPLLFLLNIHWSRKPGIPRWMSQLSSCGFFHAISDPVTICVQSGVQEEGWSVPALQKRVVKEEGQVRASSSG